MFTIYLLTTAISILSEPFSFYCTFFVASANIEHLCTFVNTGK
jgi:hypothetical protein